MLLSLTCSLLISAGIWFATSEWRNANIPSINDTIRYFGSPCDKHGISDKITGSISKLISGRLKLPEEKRRELEFELKTAHINVTPEYFIAQNISISLLTLVLSFLFGLTLWNGFYLIGAVGSVLVYRKQSGRTAEEKKKVEEKIESCMPEFALYICSYVKVNRDVISLLSGYREKCSEPVLKEELDITIADAGACGMESALIHFEARAHSSQLSNIIRALTTLANGTYRMEHFEAIEAQARQKEKERLAKAAADVPSKLKPYNFALYGAFAAMLMVMFVIIFLRFTGELI